MIPPRCANSPMPLTSTAGVVAAGRPARSSSARCAIRSPTLQRGPAAAELVPARSVRCTSASSGATSTSVACSDAGAGQDLQPLGGLVVLGQGALERQGRSLGQDADVPAGSQAARSSASAVRLLVGARDHHQRRRAGSDARRAARCAARRPPRARAGRRGVRQLGSGRRSPPTSAAATRRSAPPRESTWRWSRTSGGWPGRGPLNSFIAASIPSRSQRSAASAPVRDRLVGQLALGRLEGGQHVVDRLAGAPDPDPQPVELVRAQARR